MANSAHTRTVSESGSEAPRFEVKSTKAYLPPTAEDEIAEFQHSAPPLDGATLARLAKEFADSIPDDEFSVAALQGYLLKNKSRPEAAAADAASWVISERELRERLKKEREARELKEKVEREKRRKELLEKEKEKKAQELKDAEEVARRVKEDEEKLKASVDAGAAAQPVPVVVPLPVPVPAPASALIPPVLPSPPSSDGSSSDDNDENLPPRSSPWVEVGKSVSELN